MDAARARKVKRIVYTLAVLTMLPSIWLTYNMLRENKFLMRANAFVSHECVFPETQVVSDKAYTDNGERVISISLIGKPLQLDSLELALSSRLKFYGLEGTRLHIIQGSLTSSAEPANTVDETRTVYQMAQTTIMGQQQQIDSLRRVISNMGRDAGEEVAPELKVIFPEVSDIAINRSVFAEVGTNKMDTVNVALVHFSSALSENQRQKLKEYLETRLKVADIEIVAVPAMKREQ